jgi:hypothetical protein
MYAWRVCVRLRTCVCGLCPVRTGLHVTPGGAVAYLSPPLAPPPPSVPEAALLPPWLGTGGADRGRSLEEDPAHRHTGTQAYRDAWAMRVGSNTDCLDGHRACADGMCMCVGGGLDDRRTTRPSAHVESGRGKGGGKGGEGRGQRGVRCPFTTHPRHPQARPWCVGSRRRPRNSPHPQT